MTLDNLDIKTRNFLLEHQNKWGLVKTYTSPTAPEHMEVVFVGNYPRGLEFILYFCTMLDNGEYCLFCVPQHTKKPVEVYIFNKEIRHLEALELLRFLDLRRLILSGVIKPTFTCLTCNQQFSLGELVFNGYQDLLDCLMTEYCNYCDIPF